jgi:hypothetical protein
VERGGGVVQCSDRFRLDFKVGGGRKFSPSDVEEVGSEAVQQGEVARASPQHDE